MTMRRFYVPREEFTAREAGGVLTLGADESRHLRDVLRLRTGDEAQVFDGEGGEYLCSVTGTGRGKEGARLEVRGRVEPPSPESPLELTLGVALLKGEKFDLVVQKATELGVARVVPVVTRRADVRPRDDADRSRRAARWQRLALEAAKQSGRARVPAVLEPVEFPAFVESLAKKADELRLMFSEHGGDSLAVITMGSDSPPPSAVTALVGPEGGWEAEEVARARELGWSIITLGGRVLRAETAAVTVSALLQHLFGDLK